MTSLFNVSSLSVSSSTSLNNVSDVSATGHDLI